MISDDAVLAILRATEDGITVDDLAYVIGCSRQSAYESLWRLRGADKVKREGSTIEALWIAI
jgi:hypothetical protein